MMSFCDQIHCREMLSHYLMIYEYTFYVAILTNILPFSLFDNLCRHNFFLFYVMTYESYDQHISLNYSENSLQFFHRSSSVQVKKKPQANHIYKNNMYNNVNQSGFWGASMSITLNFHPREPLIFMFINHTQCSVFTMFFLFLCSILQ